MNLLHVFDLISPARGGGMFTNVQNITRALVDRGHRVTLYTTDFQLDSPKIDSLPGVDVYAFHSLSNAGNFFVTPGIIGEAGRHVRDYDVVHLHSFRSFQNIVVHHYARKYGIPCVVDAHGTMPRTARSKWSPKWLMKWAFDVAWGYRLLHYAGKVIAETPLGYDEYLEMGVPREKIAVFPPPFDTGRFSSLPPKGLFKKKFDIKYDHIIMFLGRLHWIKGIGFLVESFAELGRTRDDVFLVIAGPDDGYKAELEKLIAGLGLEGRVLFTGFIGGEDKLAALVDADVVVQTSVYEQGTGVPFEAVLCGTSIIVSRDTIASENVRSLDAGYLVEYGKHAELVSTLLRVLDNPDEARDKARRAAEYIRENMSLEKGAEKYEQVYAEVTGQS